MENLALIKKAGLEQYVVRGKKYPHPLPFELEESYCYTIDGGHSIIVVLENEHQEGEPVEGFLVPAPVKTVLRHGWHVRDSYVWSNIPYSKEVGLLTDESDSEY